MGFEECNQRDHRIDYGFGETLVVSHHIFNGVHRVSATSNLVFELHQMDCDHLNEEYHTGIDDAIGVGGIFCFGIFGIHVDLLYRSNELWRVQHFPNSIEHAQSRVFQITARIFHQEFLNEGFHVGNFLTDLWRTARIVALSCLNCR